jgi:hypothetical protein
MFVALLAEALTSEPPQLDLNLVCQGQYRSVETSVGNTNTVVDGQVRSGSAVLVTPVMRSGIAHLTFRGAVGHLTYPDGRERDLENVTAEPGQITAEYRRKQLIRTLTWKIEVSRLTGAVRVVSGDDIGFAGTSAPESARPKL